MNISGVGIFIFQTTSSCNLYGSLHMSTSNSFIPTWLCTHLDEFQIYEEPCVLLPWSVAMLLVSCSYLSTRCLSRVNTAHYVDPTGKPTNNKMKCCSCKDSLYMYCNWYIWNISEWTGLQVKKFTDKVISLGIHDYTTNKIIFCVKLVIWLLCYFYQTWSNYQINNCCYEINFNWDKWS